MRSVKNLTGLVFGRLTVVDRAPSLQTRRGARWLCKCACGGEVVLEAAILSTGSKRSCGCLLQDLHSLHGEARRKIMDECIGYNRSIMETRKSNHLGMYKPKTNGDPTDYSHRLPHGTYAAMLVKQGGVCAICGAAPSNGKRLHLDHCHDSEQVRGLLCHGCNCGLGHFRDDVTRMARAIQYLVSPRDALLRGGRQKE